MKKRILFCLALVLGIFTVCAYSSITRVKPGDADHGVCIHCAAGHFQVVVLPDSQLLNWHACLFLFDGPKLLASCRLEGALISRQFIDSADGKFCSKLNPPLGSKVYQFEVASNLLADSCFDIREESDSSFLAYEFNLKDLSHEKGNVTVPRGSIDSPGAR